MKLLYVILTCEKYFDTRVKWQMETWSNDVDDYIYLMNPPSGEEECYQNLSKKYVDFFLNFHYSDYYDWFFFCDDDTFVFAEKLNTVLSLFDCNENLLIGSELPAEFVKMATDLNVKACSGGAGIAVSKILIKNIQDYLRTNEYVVLKEQADVTLAIWADNAAHDTKVIDCGEFFRPESPKHENNLGLNYCITFHHCDHEDFMYLNNLK